MRAPVATEPGAELPTREVGPVTQTDVVRFAGAGGDFNPLHHDPEFARSAGFSGVLAMGQMHAGMLAAWLTDWAGVEHLREYEVRFAAPVFLGDTLSFSGQVLSVDDGIAEVQLAAVRDEDIVLRARAAINTG
ncbi:MaoC family dehydratase N-terminal domain-containing protein [Saccharopolyspora sp. HNM0986]|uniref:MaoC family dehydratase n=1 Tax=Saccharopolyspora galaxeae TaxID=2781241 RepID=UPI00190D6604|nr:MaoC/PaaZ C-terminal domain-containing protein [Saccharopolyspora sp. HNM0986]MBK0870351.1 MaoC family dehydratase N-terminal domain-containing protein [Saccharopolyspora sp. HNM0986]